MKKRCLRMFSFVMSLITLMMFCIPINSMETTLSEIQENDILDNAELPHYIIGEPPEDENFDTDMEWLKTLGVGEKTLAELKNMRVEDAELHEIISYETALTKGHVHRLKEQETDLNTVIYQNQDGTTTKYIFTKPIKYIDKDGQIRDKSKKISSYMENGYTYAMTDNSTKVYFPEFAENGIGIEFSGYSNYKIDITPIANDIASTIEVVKQDDNTVVYSEVFGANTSVVYTTQFSGLKEDIVLEEYTGQSVFRFELTTEGLTPENVGGKWVFKNSDEFIIAEFSDIIVKDSQGKTVFGSLDIVQRNDRYDIYVTVDDEFLQSSETVYPVYIDPSTEYIWESNEYIGNNGHLIPYTSIYDVGVYDDESGIASADTEFHYVGGTSIEGIVIYKLPDFYLAEVGQYTGLTEHEIGKATMSIYVETGDETDFYVYPLSSTWDISVYGEDPTVLTDTERTWHDPADPYNCQVIYVESDSGTYEIDITDIVRGWAKYNSGKSNEAYMNPENGFALVSSDYRMVRSVEYSNADDIYFTVDYDIAGGESYIYSLNSYKSLQNDEGSVSMNNFANDDEQKWIFDYLGNNEFYIRSAIYPDMVLVPSGTFITLSQISQESTDNYKWTYSYLAGGGIFLRHISTGRVLCYNGSILRTIVQPQVGTEAYEQARWGLLNVEAYVPILNVELKDNWVATGTSKYFNLDVTPSNATLRSEGMFTWSISNTNKISIEESPNMLYGANPGRVTVTLTHKLTGYTKTFTVTCGAIREGNYIIRNIATDCNFDICGPSFDNNTIIHQWEYHEGAWSRWEIELHDNGYYTIRSPYTGKYIHVLGASTLSGADIVQYEGYGGDNTYWYITAEGDGRYTISPKSNRSLVLGIPTGNDGNGAHIQQLSGNVTRNQWAFDNVGMTMTLENGGIYNIVAKHSNKALDVTGAGTANGTIVNQYPVTPGYQWQRWKLQYYGDGAYKIIDMNSGKLMSISGSSPYSNEVCHIWADDGTTGQLFRIRENRDGSYSLLSKCSNYQYVLSVGGGSTENGQIAYQYFDWGYDYQKFSFNESVADIDFILPVLYELYGYAEEYSPDSSKRHKQELVLQYVRRHPYDDLMWDIVAGAIDQGYIDYVNSQNGMLDRMFVESGNNSYGITTSAAHYIVDESGETVDFIHLCATLNAMIYSEQGYPSAIALPAQNFAGWAGDLVTVVPQVFDNLIYKNLETNYNNVYNEMYNVLTSGGQGTKLSREDLLADIDAVSVFYKSNRGSLDIFENGLKYQFSIGYQNRFTEFTSYTSLLGIKYSIEFYLSLSSFAEKIVEYAQISGILDNIDEERVLRNLTSEQKSAIATAFSYYIWECIENEQV